jgi:diguanylate cyclase (GGDEF)-like protein
MTDFSELGSVELIQCKRRLERTRTILSSLSLPFMAQLSSGPDRPPSVTHQGLVTTSPHDPAQSHQWTARSLSRTSSDWRRQDVLLGVGLVAAFSLLVLVTSVALGLNPKSLRVVASVGGATAALDLVLLLSPWPRLAGRLLMVFPVVLVVGEVSLALLTKGVAINYTAFFTLAFFYVGLTQPRGTGLVFALVAIPGWVLTQQDLTPGVGIRLLLALVIWLLLSDILAVRAAHGRAHTKRLVAQANTDVLTGLASRLLLSDRIERLGADPNRARSSLLFIDLDGFKTINDTYGHAAGDELLMAVAGRVRSTLRDGDLAARLGGDEFAALFEGSDLTQATGIATRLLATLSAPIPLSRARVTVTASIGIVEIVPSASADQVLRDADLAMYEAKSSGRNRLSVFKQDMHVRMTRRMELETELRDGVESEQFEVYFQPVVHMDTGAVVGAEALLRWRHPRRGLLVPGEFLATSEELGLMEPLGDWVLRQACTQARQWQSPDPGQAFSVAVNLSAPEMFAEDLKGRIERALDIAQLPGSLLILEITERVLMTDSSLARKRLEELRHLGVRIALDDFGTGYSSLAYLRELPVDILKIDRSFVTPLGRDHQALALLRSITAIADALSLDVVVEGVETAAQKELLVELGCHIAQGYYFGRPTSALDFEGCLIRMRKGHGAIGTDLASRS